MRLMLALEKASHSVTAFLGNWRSGICRLACFGLFVCLPALAQADLLSYWDFEGDFVDSVGINDAALIPDGAETNNATTGVVAGRAGEVLVLDGLGDGLMTPANSTLDFDLGDKFTYSFWVKAQVNSQVGNNNDRSTFLMRDTGADPYNGTSVIINATASGAGPFFRGALDGGATAVHAQITDQTEVDSVLDDQWHHVAWVVNRIGLESGKSTLYVDGTPLVETTDLSVLSSGTTSAGAVPLYLGAERATGSRWTWGSMDDVAVWDDALSADAIAGLADDTYTPLTAPLPSLLTLDVNRTTGAVRLNNETGDDLSTYYYRILSDGDSLDEVAWNSLDEQDFDTGGPGEIWTASGGSDSGLLSEARLVGSSTLTAGEKLALGAAYDPAVDAQDLIFEYRDAANGVLELSDVNYVLGGDMNGDGALTDADVNPFVLALTNRAMFESAYADVDADFVGDFTGDGLLDLGDVKDFKAAVMATGSATGSASAVPEPSTASLFVMAVGCLMIRIRRKKRSLQL